MICVDTVWILKRDWWGIGLRILLTISCYVVFNMTLNSHATMLDGLRSKLPEKILTWSKASEDQLYTPQTIFGYINGGAEVYKAYNMRRCLSRRYLTANGPAIMLDIFDMGTAKDAFGVFTHDPEGDVIDLGQDGRLRPGWVSFWKDRFFISIYSEEETVAARKAVLALGQQIDALIDSHGRRPGIIDRLPPEGLQANTIRYLHHPVILNYHYYLSDENLLNISDRTEVLLANYEREGKRAVILLVLYPDVNAAIRAHSQFSRHYLGETEENGLVLLEDRKWSGARINSLLLIIILEADTQQLAEILLQTVK